jgi:cytochrome c-type biogenesis protein CcmH
MKPQTLLAVALGALSIGAAASDPAERLADPAQEARARHLFTEVRCVVCQNESIDDSDADLADDLRKAVRGQVAAGRTDTQVKRFLVDRYGEFVLLKPSFSPGNALLWLAPFAIVVGGAGAFVWTARRRSFATPPLSPEEETALSSLEHGSAAMAPHEKRDGMALKATKTVGVSGQGN